MESGEKVFVLVYLQQPRARLVPFLGKTGSEHFSIQSFVVPDWDVLNSGPNLEKFLHSWIETGPPATA